MRKSVRSTSILAVGAALFLALPFGGASAAFLMGGQINPGGPCMGSCGNLPPPVVHQPTPPIIYWPAPPVRRPGPPVAYPLSR